MKTWKDISLYTFQRVDKISSNASLSDEDKALYVACEVFDLTEYELNDTAPKKAIKMLGAVEKMFSSSMTLKAVNRIGRYVLNYDPSSLTFGQYIELSYFLQEKERMQRAHYSLASISRPRFGKYTTEGHKIRADYFLTQPAAKTVGSLGLFVAQMELFNAEYSSMFGLDKEVYEPDVQADLFNQRYGWTYAASLVAEYERITLDAAYLLPVRQALNDLTYLKSRGRYEADQQKKMFEKLKK